MAVEREAALQLLATQRAVPFQYSHESRAFQFGDQTRQLDQVPLFGVFHQSGVALEVPDVEGLVNETAFISTFNRIHSLPRADDFFMHGWSDALHDEVTEVMEDVYSTVRVSSDAFYASDSWRPSKHDFAAVLYEQEYDPSNHAGVFLQTSGICACIKPEARPNSMFHPIEVMTYVEHNIATLPERVSVLAGLGHIARKANEYVQAQS